jgi:hypothetical protein
MKKVLISIFSAFVVVIMSLGVSTVFGAYDPGEAPPGGLTHPTFSGVNLQGNMDVLGKIGNSDTGIVQIDGDFDVVNGTIFSSLGNGVTIEDAIIEGLDAWGISSYPEANLLELTEETHFTGPLILNSVGTDNPLAGEISSVDGQDVIINGPLMISGNGVGESSAIKSDESPLLFETDVKFTGTTDVTPGGAAGIRLGTGSNWLGIDNNEMASYGSPLLLQYDANQSTQIGSSSKPSNTTVYGAFAVGSNSKPFDADVYGGLEVGDDMTVLGDSYVGTSQTPSDLRVYGQTKLTDDVQIGNASTQDGLATVFGDLNVYGEVEAGNLAISDKFYRSRSDKLSVTSKKTLSYSQSATGAHNQYCPTGVVVACNIKPYSNSLNLQYYEGMGAYTDSKLTHCQGRMYNSSTSTVYVYVEAVCFDPEG